MLPGRKSKVNGENDAENHLSRSVGDTSRIQRHADETGRATYFFNQYFHSLSVIKFSPASHFYRFHPRMRPHFFICLLILLVSIHRNDGASCECRCCIGPNCQLALAGTTNVGTCMDCTTSFCRTQFSGSCVLINGVAQASCNEYSTYSHSPFFGPPYATITGMGLISLIVRFFS